MFFLLSLLLIVPFSTQAEIFQWVDDNGSKNFSDKPHQGAKSLKIKPGYTYYQIKKIYDGDTILLTNGLKVRLLGINTPEVERRNKLAQVGGEVAKSWLQKRLKNKKVRLESDVEKKDKYGRLLAHIFTENKEHINIELVKQGLASVNIHPPNLKYTDELIKAEQQAEQARLGIWNYQEYAPKQLSQITQQRVKGWQRITGVINNIRYSRRYIYLNFTDTFALKIERKAEGLFPVLESYMGGPIEARGWVNRHKKRYSMIIRHPSAIINR